MARVGPGGTASTRPRPIRRVAGAAAVLVIAAACPARGSTAARPTTEAVTGLPMAGDALTTRTRDELANFTGWLHEHGERGYIGEVGWPDDDEVPGDAARWNALGDTWYGDADAAGLWVTYWATGEWWQDQYKLAVYEQSTDPGPVDTANDQAPIVESHASSPGRLRGVTDAGGEFGYAPTNQPTSPFSNEHPGTYDTDWHYDTQGTFDFLAERGVKLVRIPFRWERLQPQPGGRLDPEELRRIRQVSARAHGAGLKVLLDMHNFGSYYLDDGTQGVRCTIGQPGCTISDFADVWRRISSRFRTDGNVFAYGLMCEPVDLSPIGDLTPLEVWKKASRRALKAIRSTGDRRWVLVGGYEWSNAQRWSETNGAPWIHDSLHRYRYEAHHYWDRDHSGTYEHSYDDEVAYAESNP